jgi:hypothetical protein
MLRGPDPARQLQWSERLERFASSGQTVSEFCRAEGVSSASFYQWKRKLGNVDQQRKKRGEQGRRRESSAFQRLQLSARDVSSGVRICLPDGIVVELGSDFATIERIIGQVLDHQAR